MENFDRAVTDPRLRKATLEQWLERVRDPARLYQDDLIVLHSLGVVRALRHLRLRPHRLERHERGHGRPLAAAGELSRQDQAGLCLRPERSLRGRLHRTPAPGRLRCPHRLRAGTSGADDRTARALPAATADRLRQRHHSARGCRARRSAPHRAEADPDRQRTADPGHGTANPPGLGRSHPRPLRCGGVAVPGGARRGRGRHDGHGRPQRLRGTRRRRSPGVARGDRTGRHHQSLQLHPAHPSVPDGRQRRPRRRSRVRVRQHSEHLCGPDPRRASARCRRPHGGNPGDDPALVLPAGSRAQPVHRSGRRGRGVVPGAARSRSGNERGDRPAARRVRRVGSPDHRAASSLHRPRSHDRQGAPGRPGCTRASCCRGTTIERGHLSRGV